MAVAEREASQRQAKGEPGSDEDDAGGFEPTEALPSASASRIDRPKKAA